MLKFITEYTKSGCRELQDYLNCGGYRGLQIALSKAPEAVIAEVEKSNLRGRGGAYFPAAMKWKTFGDINEKEKYLICNGDEGEPGTFKDRYLLLNCPWQIIEGMLITAYATGATKGLLYLRGEYADLCLPEKLNQLRAKGLLGEKILDTDFSFDIQVQHGAGAYICGEESALINSIEGSRPVTRNKPFLPVRSGLWEKPTLIHNVESFATITQIIRHGAEHFLQYGLNGTKLICASGAFPKRGVFEVPLGIPIGALLEFLGISPNASFPVKFIQLGGLTGFCGKPTELWNLSYDIDALKKEGMSVGTGAIYGGSTQIDYLDYMIAAFHFFADESCGRCTPCREGHHQILNELLQLKAGSQLSLPRICRIADTMAETSACGLGQATPLFLNSILKLYVNSLTEEGGSSC